MKKWILTLLFALTCFGLFADDWYFNPLNPYRPNWPFNPMYDSPRGTNQVMSLPPEVEKVFTILLLCSGGGVMLIILVAVSADLVKEVKLYWKAKQGVRDRKQERGD